MAFNHVKIRLYLL